MKLNIFILRPENRRETQQVSENGACVCPHMRVCVSGAARGADWTSSSVWRDIPGNNTHLLTQLICRLGCYEAEALGNGRILPNPAGVFPCR